MTSVYMQLSNTRAYWHLTEGADTMSWFDFALDCDDKIYTSNNSKAYLCIGKNIIKNAEIDIDKKEIKFWVNRYDSEGNLYFDTQRILDFDTITSEMDDFDIRIICRKMEEE